MRNKTYSIILSFLIALFAFRVIAQFMQKYTPVSFLPSLEAWQGSGLPYHWLLFSQIILLGIMGRQIFLMTKDRIAPNLKLGKFFLITGSIYFGSMLLRMIAGLTFAADIHWFATTLPSFFHMILASFILVLARYHRKNSTKAV